MQILSDHINSFREFQVVVGDAVAVVRCRFYICISPAELDVGVMIGGLGNLADLIDKGQAFGKIGKFEFLFDLVVVKFPPV